MQKNRMSYKRENKEKKWEKRKGRSNQKRRTRKKKKGKEKKKEKDGMKNIKLGKKKKYITFVKGEKCQISKAAKPI